MANPGTVALAIVLSTAAWAPNALAQAVEMPSGLFAPAPTAVPEEIRPGTAGGKSARQFSKGDLEALGFGAAAIAAVAALAAGDNPNPTSTATSTSTATTK